MARHVKKGDTVVVIAGNDKGKTGDVLRVDPEAETVLVQGVNRVYRHLRPSRQNPHGGRIQKEMPIHISNVLPLAPKTNAIICWRAKPSRRLATLPRAMIAADVARDPLPWVSVEGMAWLTRAWPQPATGS